MDTIETIKEKLDIFIGIVNKCNQNNKVILGLTIKFGKPILQTRLAARRLRRRAGPPSYRVILRSGICCLLSLTAVNHIIQPAPEKFLSFDTPFQGNKRK